jgi:hypothetical protein
MNQPLTTFSNLLVCNKSGVPAIANFGSATVIDNCTSCQAALPLRLVSFSATITGNDVVLKWTTEYEESVNKFVIEKSNGIGPFAVVGEIPARNLPSPSFYSFSTRIYEACYFRLRMVDIDGHIAYSKVVAARTGMSSVGLAVLVNPVTDGTARMTLYSDGETNGEFILHDITGRLMKKFTAHLSTGINFIRLPVNELIPGVYSVQYHDSKIQTSAIRLIKLN